MSIPCEGPDSPTLHGGREDAAPGLLHSTMQGAAHSGASPHGIPVRILGGVLAHPGAP